MNGDAVERDDGMLLEEGESTRTVRGADPTHEPNAVSVRMVLAAACGLAVTIALALVAARGVIGLLAFRGAADVRPPKSSGVAARLTEPALDPDRRLRRAEERREEDVRLNSYGWVDRQKGIARIPIRRAMEIVAREDAAKRESREKK